MESDARIHEGCINFPFSCPSLQTRLSRCLHSCPLNSTITTLWYIWLCINEDFKIYTWCQIPRKTVSLFSRESKSRETSGLKLKTKLQWQVSRGTWHFNKKITGANQNGRLGTVKNTNLILKTTEWMMCKVLSLYYLYRFPPPPAVSLLG